MIHIKNMHSQLDSRPKVFGDLMHEVRLLFVTDDVVEVAVDDWDAAKCTFNISRPGYSKPTVSLVV